MANPDPSPRTRWQPGQSGNPKGRPRTKPLTDRLREAIEAVDDEGRSVADRIVEKWIERASGGDVMALKEMLNRLEGKAPLRVEATLEHDSDFDLPAILEALGLVPDPRRFPGVNSIGELLGQARGSS
jgi:hypothetical protein